MDIDFRCRHCNQSLSADTEDAGTEIKCPACGGSIRIPHADPMHAAPRIINAMASSAAAREGAKQFAVPQHATPSEVLAHKPASLPDAPAKEGGALRTKCIRHFDCVEVGKDRFDEVLTNFINKIGESNIVRLETFNYAHRDMETREFVTDFGVFILYRT
jgi:DNA-directed RNA polymerase subunit RPC12/RpoP